MRRTAYISLLFVMLNTTMLAQQANFSKMSPYIRHAVLNQITEKTTCAKAPEATVEKQQRICAFVRLNGNSDSTFAANGCHELAKFGDISIADIPLCNIGKLSLANNVTRIETGQGTHLLMDSMAIQLNATDIYKGTALPQAYTGKGVVMGIQDVGFDLTHPNFHNAEGTEYRIKSFWDQLSVDTVDSKMYVGAEYTTKEEILGYAHSRDGLIETHGTLTLGAAAGSGCGGKYRGIAYESEICLVNNAVSNNAALIRPEDMHKYTYATDALGFKYIFDYAAKQGLPCVISFSEGSREDFRGDDILYYEVLRRMCGPGRIIVSAAGNTGHVKNYMMKPRGRNSSGTFLQLFGNKSLYFTTISDGDFNIRMVTYKKENDTLMISTSDVVATTDSIKTYKATMSGDTYNINVVAYHSCYDNSKTAFDVSISGPKHLGMGTPLSIEIVGNEKEIEFYRGNGDMTTSNRNPKLCDGENSHGINSPSSSPYIICVGASSYRTQYINHEGKHVTYDCGSNGERASYSSEGPTYYGRTKPDVLAPGTNIIVSASSYYIENNPGKLESLTETFCKDGRTYGWLCASGTSMSSPAVGGIIALWLQAKPNLTPDDVFSILSRTSSRYEEMSTIPDNRYGYGQIDAYRGMLDILGLSSIEDISKRQPTQVSFRIDGKTVYLKFKEPATKDFTVSVYNNNGMRLIHKTISANTTEHTLDLSRFQHGVYIIQINGHNVATTGSTMVRI